MTARTYRLSAPDRTGVLLGLTSGQVAVTALGVTGAVTCLAAGGPPPAALVIVVAAAVAAFASIDGQLLVDWVGPATAWLVRRTGRSWHANLPLSRSPSPPWPAAFDGQRIIAVTDDGQLTDDEGAVAVVFDDTARRAALTMAVSGRHLALTEPAERDAHLAGWGEALASFCRDRHPVVALRWAEWRAPAGLGHHLRHLDGVDRDPAFDGAYRTLVTDNESTTVGHHVLVTLVADARRAGGGDASVAGLLVEQARLLAGRLTHAGLDPSVPLTGAQLGRAVRVRLEPGQPGRGATLAAAARMVPANWGPLATEATWSWWRTDGWYHRGLYVADWPRTEIDAAWMGELLLAAPHVVRTVAVFYDPVPPRRSRRRIERESTKLDSDQEHRLRSGFRIGADHHAARHAVAARDAEVTAGYREFTYAGVVTVSAPDPITLDRDCAEITQVAAATGVDLRPLHGRHDQAVAATVPLARGLNPAPPR